MTVPCKCCAGLGFRSLDDAKLNPAFNVWGLSRRIHPNGRVTWEGDCVACGGTGEENPQLVVPQNKYMPRVMAIQILNALYSKFRS